MKTISVQEPINLKVVRFELDFSALASTQPRPEKKQKEVKIPREIRINIKKQRFIPPPPIIKSCRTQHRDVKDLIEELLDELYADQRDWSSNSAGNYSRGSASRASFASSQSYFEEQTNAIERIYLEDLETNDLRQTLLECEERLKRTGQRLARCVQARDRLRRQQKRLCAGFTILLRHISGFHYP